MTRLTTVYLTAAVAVLMAACGSDSTGPAIIKPAKPNISGVWTGNVSSATLTMALSHDTLTNQVAGTTTAKVGNVTVVVLTVAGVYTSPSVSLNLTAAGYQPANFTGSHASNSIVGTLNGSGWQNAAVTFVR